MANTSRYMRHRLIGTAGWFTAVEYSLHRRWRLRLCYLFNIFGTRRLPFHLRLSRFRTPIPLISGAEVVVGLPRPQPISWCLTAETYSTELKLESN
jgi:hypothetical protein